MKQNSDPIILDLYTAWCIEEFNANCVYDEVDEDFTHPRFLKAEKKARKALRAFLYKPTASLRGILLKLQIACDCEDYLADTLDPACTAVAPHAVIAAANDLEAIVTSRSEI
jgi:hypothetical protein